MGKAKKPTKKKNEESDDAMETAPQTEIDDFPKSKKKKGRNAEEKKAKKNKKNVDSEEESEEDSTIEVNNKAKVEGSEDEDLIPKTKQKKKANKDSDEDAPKPKTRTSKQKKKKTQDSDDEEPPPKPKAKQKKKKTEESDDDEVEDAPMATVTSSFALLDVEDVDVPSEDDDEPEPEPQPKPKPAKKEKKGKKSKRKNKQDEDDIDKLLEELQMEYSGQKRGMQDDEPETKEEQEEPKKVEETKKEEDTPPKDEKKEDEEESTVKTAAQKKKEKKEREKQRKLEEKQKAAKKAEKAKQPQATSTEKSVQEIPGEPKETVTPPPKEEKPEEGEQEEEGDGKKKKKDKKKKGKDKKEEEEEKKKKKGPGSAAIKAMQEQLRKIQEEEERLKREEEERIRKIEEEEKMKEEKLQREKEKKEREKQKKKERLQRAKAEGRYMTAKQKADRAKQLAMLEAMRAQGVEIPARDKPIEKTQGKTRVIQPKGKKLSKGPSPETEVKPEEKELSEKIVKVEIVDKKEERKPEDDVKDSWDQDSEEEEKTEEKPEVAEESESEAESEESEEDDEEEDESGESDSEESESEEEEPKTEAQKKRERALARIMKRKEEAKKTCTTDVLRAPVVCVLGHVDTGKTKILDKLRRTNVQEGEAGGITQQIGATNVPEDAIKLQARMVKGFSDMELKIPGMLIIDTPGHESFSNLRSRGSSLCDIAVLVIDIMHGLEPQTLESISLLKKGKTPFVVALNKIDRLYDWITNKNKDVEDLINQQPKNTLQEFQERTKHVIVQLAEQGLNAKLCYENENPREYVSLVPTSAWTGDGMGNLIGLLAKLTQSMLAKRIAYSESLQATVLEVKAIPGLGTTVDVILVNGRLREGDTIILAGTEGPVITQIRSLLMPQPMKELRVKNAYVEHKEVRAAQGVKIAAKELEKAVAGLNLQVAEHPDEVDILREVVNREFSSVMNSIKLSERGVYVQASTLGSLEALLEFLRTSKIPYSGVRIGPVVKKDVMKASIMLEHEVLYAVILAFDVKIERDAQELADNLNVKIFQADIIYHLFDSFVKYQTELKAKRKEEHKHIAVFPCKIKILPQFIFNSRDPIVMGVSVEAGVIKEGTPICVPAKEFLEIGIVTTIEINHKPIPEARKGQEVCIKIEPIPGDAPKMFGRHFDEKDMLVSKISRESIDACKNYFREDLLKSDWQLMIELKKVFAIL